jgi:hypothetical protein
MPRQGGFIEPTLQRFRVGEHVEVEVHADNSVYLIIPRDSDGQEECYLIPRESSPLWRMLANKLDMQISGAA